jgi:hypothetical protein
MRGDTRSIAENKQIINSIISLSLAIRGAR